MEFMREALNANQRNDNEEAIAQCICGIATLSPDDYVASLCFSNLIESFSSNTGIQGFRTMNDYEVKHFSPLPSFSVQQSQTANDQLVSKVNSIIQNNENRAPTKVKASLEENIESKIPESRFTSTSSRFKSKNIEESEAPSFQTAAAALGKSNLKKNKLSKSQIANSSSNGNNSNNAINSAIYKRPMEEGRENSDDDGILAGIDKQIIEKIESDILQSVTNVKWEDVAGLEHAKQAVKEAIILPMKHPEVFKGLRNPPRGVLLFGPPGTGKTMIAKALANEAKCTFFNISASSLTSKWVGEGEKLTRALFAVATKHAPSIIFIDEIDSLLTKRNDNEFEATRRVKNEFLLRFQGLSSGEERILVLGATNRPQDLDDAARRRFERRIYIPLPDAETRKALVTLLLNKDEHEVDAQQFDRVVELTEGYSCADITTLFNEAAMIPLRSSMDLLNSEDKVTLRPLTIDDILIAIKKVRPSVSPDSLKVYEDWDSEFGYAK